MATFNNTIINRLGYTRAWEMSWAEKTFRMYKNYIQKDFLLFRLIKIYFVHYSTPLFTHTFHRNIKGEGKKKSAKKHIINNYFIDLGINFSHLEITRNPYLGLNCYFMDTLMEDWKLKYNYKAKKLPSFYIRTREHTRVSLYRNKGKVQRKQYPLYPKLRKRRFLAKIKLLKKAKPYAFRDKIDKGYRRVLTINKHKRKVSKRVNWKKVYKNIKEKLKIIKRKAFAKKRNTKFYRLMNEMFNKRNSHIKPIKQKVNVKRIKRYKPKIKKTIRKQIKLHFLYKNTSILENIKISKRRIFKGRFKKFRVKKLSYNMAEELKLIYGKNRFRRNPRKYRIMQKGIKHTPYMKEEAAAADLIKRYKKLKMAKDEKYKSKWKKRVIMPKLKKTRKLKGLVINKRKRRFGKHARNYYKNTRKVLTIPSIPLTIKKYLRTNLTKNLMLIPLSKININEELHITLDNLSWKFYYMFYRLIHIMSKYKKQRFIIKTIKQSLNMKKRHTTILKKESEITQHIVDTSKIHLLWQFILLQGIHKIRKNKKRFKRIIRKLFYIQPNANDLTIKYSKSKHTNLIDATRNNVKLIKTKLFNTRYSIQNTVFAKFLSKVIPVNIKTKKDAFGEFFVYKKLLSKIARRKSRKQRRIFNAMLNKKQLELSSFLKKKRIARKKREAFAKLLKIMQIFPKAKRFVQKQKITKRKISVQKLRHKKRILPVFYNIQERHPHHYYRYLKKPIMTDMFSRKRYIKRRLQRYPLFTIDTFLRNKRNMVFPRLSHNIFKILLVLIVGLGSIFKFADKKQYFFFILCKNALLSLLQLPLFIPKLAYLRMINFLFIAELSWKFTQNYIYGKLLTVRGLFFQMANAAIVSSIMAFDKTPQKRLSFFGLHNRNITAKALLNYLILKLSQYFQIQEILRPVLNDLKRSPAIKAFRIVVAGRLTRKERAGFAIKQRGNITLGTRDITLDMAQGTKIQKFGMVGLKIFLNKDISKKPNHYRFSYNNIYLLYFIIFFFFFIQNILLRTSLLFSFSLTIFNYIVQKIFINKNQTLLNYFINNKYFYKIIAVAYLFADKYILKYNVSLLGNISLNILCVGIIFRLYCLLYPISTTISLIGYFIIILHGLLRSWIIFCLTIHDLFFYKLKKFMQIFLISIIILTWFEQAYIEAMLRFATKIKNISNIVYELPAPNRQLLLVGKKTTNPLSTPILNSYKEQYYSKYREKIFNAYNDIKEPIDAVFTETPLNNNKQSFLKITKLGIGGIIASAITGGGLIVNLFSLHNQEMATIRENEQAALDELNKKKSKALQKIKDLYQEAKLTISQHKYYIITLQGELKQHKTNLHLALERINNQVWFSKQNKQAAIDKVTTYYTKYIMKCKQEIKSYLKEISDAESIIQENPSLRQKIKKKFNEKITGTQRFYTKIKDIHQNTFVGILKRKINLPHPTDPNHPIYLPQNPPNNNPLNNNLPINNPPNNNPPINNNPPPNINNNPNNNNT